MQKTGLHRVGSGRSQRHSNLIGSTTYDGKIAGLYDLEETLGRGHFAVVKLARHVFTGEKVAVKVIDKTKLDEISRAHLFQEVRCMKLVQHPNVVRLYEVIDTQTKLYLILELADGGDLYDYIMRHENGLDEESARHYFRQVVQAISYCHQLHVVHRDLKPENVVFFEKLSMVKLTDFGFSNKYNPGQKLETSCGSLAYSAPEILLGDSYDAPAVDIWSLGVILYMLVCGHPPFQEANDSETLTMIMDCKYTIPSHVSEPCRRLIASMLQRDPAKRSTLQDIANDLWLQDGNTLQPSDYLPLVSREHLTEEDHALILQKMVNGKIATKEEIIEALDKNEYNNITATYFLLAERKLRTQRQERAQMVTRGQRPEAPKPEHQTKPLAAEETVEVSKPETRVRKFSIVEEEEEIATASGSESSRRTSNNSLTSQRTSNTSLASQRTSNNSLAGSLRSRGLLTNPPTTRLNIIGQRSTDLRLDLQQGVVRKPPPVKITPEEKTPETVKTAEPPAPFPTTCGIGLGLRSPLTSPGSVNKAAASPSSVSPGTPSTPSSPSPASSNITSPQGSSKRTLPSPSRVLHAVRSSPQLVLNEIFEEAESGSDSEATFGDKPVHVFVSSSTSSRRTSPRASSVGPSVFKVRSSGSSTSPPNLVRRYEQRRQMAKNRTASCSSSDASDDDNESRKKRAGKIKPFPRRDSHDDSSDPGGDGPGGPDGGGEGVAGGNGTSSVSLIPSSVSSVTRGESSSSTGNSSNTPTSSNRSYLQPSICRTQDLRTRSKYRLLGGGKPRHSVDSSYALLSPNMGSETHLRASQSLSCLPEVCEAPEGSAVAVLETSLTAAIPALSCTNLGRLNEGDAFPSPEASRKQNGPQTAETESNSPETSWLGDESTPTETSPNGASCSSNPVEVRKLKKVKHFFSRREHDPSRSSHKRLVRRLRAKNTGTKNSSSASEELDSDSRLHHQGAEASEAKEEKGRALSFFRSRLYKARSLGSLVKERIMVEASNCQNELWRRLGRSADVNQNRSSSALPGSHGTKKIFPFAQKARNSSPPVVVEEFVDAPPANPSMNQIVGGVSTQCSPC